MLRCGADYDSLLFKVFFVFNDRLRTWLRFSGQIKRCFRLRLFASQIFDFCVFLSFRVFCAVVSYPGWSSDFAYNSRNIDNCQGVPLPRCIHPR